ncbi:MAG TPA: GntR family transcriptional regulator [Ruminococcaceae bacterium]|nr:GntR family transcriptional regulator [Oscillospiraceae bacterium]
MFSKNQYDTGTPIYLQIIHRIRQKIVSGEWQPGDRVPGVRDLAIDFGVNPNTMQRSLAELERDGLLYSERTSGRFITDNATLISEARDTMARGIILDFISQMAKMGYNKTQIREQLETLLKDAANEGETK